MINSFDIFRKLGFENVKDDPNIMIFKVNDNVTAQLFINCDIEDHYIIAVYTPLRTEGTRLFNGYIETENFALELIKSLKLETIL